jgi:hypothetical protein
MNSTVITGYTQYSYSVLMPTSPFIDAKFGIDPATPFVLVTRFSNPDGSESDCYVTPYSDASEARTQLLTHSSYYDRVHGEQRDFSGVVSLMHADQVNTYLPIPALA